MHRDFRNPGAAKGLQRYRGTDLDPHSLNRARTVAWDWPRIPWCLDLTNGGPQDLFRVPQVLSLVSRDLMEPIHQAHTL